MPPPPPTNSVSPCASGASGTCERNRYFVAEKECAAVIGGQGGESELGGECSQSASHGNDQHTDYGHSDHNELLREIFDAVASHGTYNVWGARTRVPSGLCIEAWREYLRDYEDPNLVDFLAYGWPINFDRRLVLEQSYINHTSARHHDSDVVHYIDTEMGWGALAGPFEGPPVVYFHSSPLMTRPKKDSDRRRVIVDLSWPDGASVNDGIEHAWYLDGPAIFRLPTVDYMEQRLLQLGPGAFLYKTDLARGYRQLRVDPLDWPLLGFIHEGRWFMDICPPFGLRTSALFMQRTSEAVCYIHKKAGFYSRPYLDDFGGAERTHAEAATAMATLQGIMRDLGLQEAVHKACGPAQQLTWLGLLYDSVRMTITILPPKMQEIMLMLREWEGRQRATQAQLQSLLGTLQFVASVSPPTRIFTNRMLQCLREAPKRGSETLSWGFKRDLAFFLALLPRFNGIKIIAKEDICYQDSLELDACLTGCGACTDTSYYTRQFPQSLIDRGHSIAHLELLNIVVALKVWCHQWAGHRVKVWSDNTNACAAVTTGRSRDLFVQDCVREIFLFTAAHDIELHVSHRPGVQLIRADALSRAHTAQHFRDWIRSDPLLAAAREIVVPDMFFELDNAL